MQVDVLTNPQKIGSNLSNGAKGLPPLENGDRLTRREFERRYEAMPEIKKAELIEGVVFISSPVRYNVHAAQNGLIVGWLAVYSASTPGTDFGDNATLRLDADNQPQPDAVLRIKEEFGGKSKIVDGYLEGAPELLIEIAASTTSNDLGDKKRVYRRNGVREYIVWRVYDEAIDWFVLENEEYVSLSTDENGIAESRIFPGLRLNIEAMLKHDLATVLADLQANLQTAEHAQFVKGVQAAKQK